MKNDVSRMRSSYQALRQTIGQPNPRDFDAAQPSDDGWRAVDWGHYTRDALIRGRRIRYVDIGSGPAVVLIHGQGGAWQWWLRTIPRVALKSRVIALDLAGFGASEPVAAGDAFDEQAETVIGLLDHLRLAGAAIAGHSMGGLVSMRVACDHPERVTGLILINSGSDGISTGRLKILLAAFRVFDLVFSAPAVPRLVAQRRSLRRLFFALAVARPQQVTRMFAEQIVPLMAAPGFIANMKAAGAAVSQTTPHAISVPALVIWGREDRIVPLSSGRRLADAVPGAHLVVLDDVGHCPMIEKPEETAALIAGFVLDSVNGRSASVPHSQRDCGEHHDPQQSRTNPDKPETIYRKESG